jgi:hypothetical protein
MKEMVIFVLFLNLAAILCAMDRIQEKLDRLIEIGETKLKADK